MRSLIAAAGALLCLSLTSAPAAAAEEGSNLTRRAHHFANTWFDHVEEGDWDWLRRSTNTKNIPMRQVRALHEWDGMIEVDSCYRTPDFGGEPEKPRLRYCFTGDAEWKVVRLDNGRLKMKDVNWYQ